MSTRWGIKAKTAQDVRGGLVRVVNAVGNRKLDPKEANAMIYGLNAVLSSLRVDEQARRIDELEKRLEAIGK